MAPRDYSRPSQAAKLRLMGTTRIHCDVPYGGRTDSEQGEDYITERWLARGSDEDEDVCERFNAELQHGHRRVKR